MIICIDIGAKVTFNIETEQPEIFLRIFLKFRLKCLGYCLLWLRIQSDFSLGVP